MACTNRSQVEKNERQKRSLGLLILAILSLGYLGVSARMCARAQCGAILGVMITISAASVMVCLILSLLLLLNIRLVGRVEWIFDGVLLAVWSTALALTLIFVEGALPTIFVQLIVALAWIATLFNLMLFVTALCGCDGPCRKQYETESRKRPPTPAPPASAQQDTVRRLPTAVPASIFDYRMRDMAPHNDDDDDDDMSGIAPRESVYMGGVAEVEANASPGGANYVGDLP